MTFMKTSDLSDGYLDLAVAQALGHKDCFVNLAGNCVQPYKTNDGILCYRKMQPTQDSRLMVLLIKKHNIGVEPIGGGWWGASAFVNDSRSPDGIVCLYGKSYEEALFRCFVTMLCGENISIGI